MLLIAFCIYSLLRVELAEVRPGLLRALEEHFFYHFRISLSAFLLYRISTPVAHVNSSGKLKVRLPHLPQQPAHDTHDAQRLTCGLCGVMQLTEANISLVFQQLAIYAQL